METRSSRKSRQMMANVSIIFGFAMLDRVVVRNAVWLFSGALPAPLPKVVVRAAHIWVGYCCLLCLPVLVVAVRELPCQPTTM